MSSNHLDLSSVWKSLVASCVCVCVCVCVRLKVERAFSTRSFPALKRSYAARNAFVSDTITRSSSN